MDVEKDIKSVDVRKRILNAVYMHGVLNVDKEKRLSLAERALYAAMLDFATSGEKFKRGWIKNLQGEGISFKSQNTQVARIKENNWLKMKGDQYIFPPSLLKIVKAIKEEQPVDFIVKV